MADRPIEYNPMHANMGLLPQTPSAVGIPTPSPGETSAKLMDQAMQRVVQSHQMLQSTPLAAAQTFSAQFQQRFQEAQAIQGISPIQAQFMAGAQRVPGGGPSYYPSPLMMTPAQTGVFRPPTPSPIMPVPPMYTPPIIPMPFQPQMPQPMFQSPADQQAMIRDLQANRMFSYGMQVPSVAGQALGIGGGAYLGSRIMGGFGPMGRLAGAIGGGLLASRSGVADTIGDFSQLPFQPMIETRQMGSALQRMSQDWVVTGPQLHALGRGLTQQASIGLAGGIRELATDSGFKEQTGGMFNRQDLMRMTQLSGQAGLMDMAQSVPQIREQLRQVAITVRRFMELTNDPDITNVIREMGQLRQFGLNMQQIDQAAENMRMFSRGAGTSIRGLREMAGLPGAAVFQGVGLTAGLGFDYGNYSLMQARQAVAGGAIDPRQLALLGGVQGMAQRNMQAQAAFTSMPLFAAANAQFGGGGWGANAQPGVMGGGQGAFGMVNAAIRNLGMGVQRGGIGALASFQLQQQEVADMAASQLTPMEQTAQRFRIARETGQRMGLRGLDALSFGAQILYPAEVANQMMIEARNPEMWQSQQRMYRERLNQMGIEQYQATAERAPGMFGHLYDRYLGGTVEGLRRGGASLGEAIAQPFQSAGRAISDFATSVSDYFTTPEGVSRFRPGRGMTMTGEQARAAFAGDPNAGRRPGYLGGDLTGGRSGWDNYWNFEGRMADFHSAMIDSSGGSSIWKNPIISFINPLTEKFTSALNAKAFYDFGAGGSITPESMAQFTSNYYANQTDLFRMVERGKRNVGSVKDIAAGANALSRALPRGKDGYEIMNKAATIMAARAQDYVFSPNEMTRDKAYQTVIDAMSQSGIQNAGQYFNSLSPGEREQITSQVLNMAKQGNPTVANVIDVVSAAGGREKYFERVDEVTKDAQRSVDQRRSDMERWLFQSAEQSGRYITTGTEKPTGVLAMLLGGGGEGAEDIFGSTEAFEKTKEIAKGMSRTDVALLSAVAAQQSGEKGAYGKAKSLFLKSGGKEGDWIAKHQSMRDMLAGMDEDVRSRFAKLGSAKYLENVQQWQDLLKQGPSTVAARSQAFVGMFEPYAGSSLTAAMQKEGPGSIMSVEDVIGTLSPEAIQQMMKSPSAQARQLGKLAQSVRQGGEGGQKALARLNQMAISMGGTEEVQDRALTTAEGPAAKAASASADAASEMSLVASEFIPAVKDFKAAAKMLLDSQTIQLQNNMQGR